LTIVAEIAAGAIPTRPIQPGECVRIFTGAPIPDGADAVVMQEDTAPLDGDRVRITDAKVKPNQWVFARGTEMRAGDVVLSAGSVLNPAALGVLAGVGRTKAEMFPTPTVSVLATGSELVEPGWEMQPGQIRNSNTPMLRAQAISAGAEVATSGMCGDNPETLRFSIESSISDAHVLVIAGGVSVGKFDLVPATLEELGVTFHVRQVRMKPGKPFLFGTKDETLVFGLPGNPVSAFVCFELFVRPALRKLAGHPEAGPLTMALPLAEGIAEVNDRPTYRPAKLERGDAGFVVRPLPWHGAPDLRGMQPADALVALPPGESRLDRGMAVSVVLI
jgi:molybdopterin molybdotransferase